MTKTLHGVAVAIATVAVMGMSLAAENGAARAAARGPHSPPPLQLSDDQRARIRDAVRQEDTEVTFQLKATKKAADFTPTINAKLPASVKPHPFPRPLIYQMPLLKQYGYVKLKNEVLVINPMTHKIVDMFPES